MSKDGMIKAAAANVPAGPSKSGSPANIMRGILSKGAVREMFENTLKEKAAGFISGVIDLYASDTYLQQCDAAQVAMEALKAATLDLPINKQLGFAYVVPYKKNNVQIPQFQLGYKGYIQLAQRTGAYRYLNADLVFEGEFKSRDKLTGAIDLTGERTGNTVVGYFAYIETLNGYSKSLYMTREEVRAWAGRYSAGYKSGKAGNPWMSNFDEMALKTCLRRLISKWGIMSVEMAGAISADERADMQRQADNALTEPLSGPTVIEGEVTETDPNPETAVDPETGEVVDLPWLDEGEAAQ